nr:PD-(D/E)XK nuclease family protein [Bacteroides sp.]
DFKNLIIMSLNEGQLPKSGGDASFIPYNLRKAFGMTIIEHKNAVYAYYFYRLIQRAENVTLLYNSSSDSLNKGEWSRFMLQLLLEWPNEIKKEYIESGQSPQTIESITINKSPNLLLELEYKFDTSYNNSALLSPSALNTYLDCPLKFYYKYVAGLNRPNKVSSEIDAAQFGSIFHLSAQKTYEYLTSRDDLITKDVLESLMKNDVKLQSFVDFAFNNILFKSNDDLKPEYNGQQLINSKVIVSYLKQLLRNDIQYAPFQMIAMEKFISEDFPIIINGKKLNLRFGGIIDRIDRKEDTLRIVDYKTGGTPETPANLEALFTPSKKRPSHIFQTFLYASIQCKKESLKVAPSLLYIHHASSETYSPIIEIGEPRKAKIAVSDFSIYEEKFRDRLSLLIKEIFNPEIPFTQTKDIDFCEYCDFKTLCKK